MTKTYNLALTTEYYYLVGACATYSCSYLLVGWIVWALPLEARHM